MARRSSAVVAALVHTISVASQNIAVNCGSQARNTIVPDNVFQEVKVRDNLLPSMRDTICNFGQDGACTALGGRCIIESIFYNENDKISVTLNKTLTIGPNGGNAQLGPCSRVMDEIISQCIDGSKKVSTGSANVENVDYRISIGRPVDLPTGQAIQDRWFSPDEATPQFIAQLPQEVQDVINRQDSTGSTLPPASPSPPPPSPGNSCEQDCQGVIDNLKNNFGDTIDINNENDLSKIVDFARGRGNPLDWDWWRLTSSGNCFLTLGKDAGRRGFSDGVPPIQKSQLIDFINKRKLFFCINANPKLVASEPQNAGRDGEGQAIGFMQVCLADFDNYQKCTGQVPLPS